MDDIYSNAFATIVAAGSMPGLPGVGGVPRQHQAQAYSRGQLFASTLPSLRLAISNSPWITRGWTFQEAILSRRCLFFTDHQVYFVCRESTRSESLFTNHQTHHTKEQEGIALMDSDIIAKEETRDGRYFDHYNHAGPWEFGSLLQRFSGRYLSNSTDALNAFRGILNRVSYPTYLGIPLISFDLASSSLAADASARFSVGLGWEPIHGDTTSLVRRQGFPSWSWAGWKGQVGYFIYLTGWRRTQTDTDMLTPIALGNGYGNIKIQVKENGNMRSMEEVQQEERREEALHLTSSLIIESTVLHLQIVFHTGEDGPDPGYYVLLDDDLLAGTPILFCQRPDQNGEMHKRLLSNEWIGVVFFRIGYWEEFEHRPFVFVILVDKMENGSLERIGSVWLRPAELQDLEPRRARLELF